jgi:HEAT repeat protein
MTSTPESARALLTSENFGDRLHGINQLRVIDKAAAFELVQLVISDSNTRVRYAAVSLMDTIGDVDLVKSLAILRSCLADPEYDVKSAAADALGGLQLTAAIPELVDLYHSTTEWLLQLSIVAALGSMPDPLSLKLFAESIGSEIELVRMTTVQAIGEMADPAGVEILQRAIADPDIQIRFRVAEALGRIGDEAAKQLLQTMVTDSDPKVAAQAKAFL